ncbi:MAG: glycerate kinase [Rhodobacteraceae bacterium]|nr:glycerate kinase [Paracoccaceae bacterium]
MDPRALLGTLFRAALDAAGPEGRYAPLPSPPRGRTLALGAGKAAARMAAAFEDAWEAHAGALPEGLVVTRRGHGAPTRAIEVAEASHPVPDAAGEIAARRILALAAEAGPDDLVVFLMSGGASALLAAPAEGVSLGDKQAIGRALLRSGAPIDEMNRVRQALSAVKGGRLAAVAGARGAACVTWAISDVPGDAPAVIGSGPTVPLPEGEAPEAILARRGVALPDHLAKAMAANPAPALAPQDFHLLATPQMALEAAAAAARKAGLTPVILGDSLEGEAREVATVMAGIARQVLRHGQPAARPCVLLSGGETTVTVRGDGRGGRNAEFLLALALALGEDLAGGGIHALAADTDGIDGVETNAGAMIGPDTRARAATLGLNLRQQLDANDAFTAFEALGDLVTTGPTLTNVNDFRAILIP